MFDIGKKVDIKKITFFFNHFNEALRRGGVTVRKKLGP